MAKMRLDELLVKQGLAQSRSQAKALILAGKVRSGTTILDKGGKTYPVDTALRVEQPPRFVGRGGEKLEGALQHFKIDPSGLHHLDVGASTGGFTDCLLQHGAIAATCVDVGRAQLHGKLLADPRVTNLEQINARHLDQVELPLQSYPLVVMDLSFISLKKVLEPVWRRVAPHGHLIALIKPQFEALKEEVDKAGGVIRDPEIQERCRDEVLESAENLPKSQLLGVMYSPIKGTDGNREFLAAWQKQQD